MGKKAMVVFFLCVVVMVGACSAQPESSSAVREPFKTADELISEAEAREQEEQAPAVEPEGAAVLEGKFVCAMEHVDAAFFPTLMLGEDGKAVFTANLLTAMGEVRADYTITDLVVKLTVTGVSFDGFNGEKTTEIVFNRVSEDELELAYVTPDGPVGATYKGDRFVREK